MAAPVSGVTDQSSAPIVSAVITLCAGSKFDWAFAVSTAAASIVMQSCKRMRLESEVRQRVHEVRCRREFEQDGRDLLLADDVKIQRIVRRGVFDGEVVRSFEREPAVVRDDIVFLNNVVLAA